MVRGWSSGREPRPARATNTPWTTMKMPKWTQKKGARKRRMVQGNGSPVGDFPFAVRILTRVKKPMIAVSAQKATRMARRSQPQNRTPRRGMRLAATRGRAVMARRGRCRKHSSPVSVGLAVGRQNPGKVDAMKSSRTD